MSKRQVVFYECQDLFEAAEFNRLEALGEINDLDEADWRVPDADTHMAVIVDRVGSSTVPSRLRLLRIRDDAPYVLSAARDLSLVEVDEDESITEFTYAVLWPDKFMAALSSRDAPNHKRLGQYFRATSGQHTHIVNLFEPDVIERLRELRDNGLRNVQVKIRASNLVQIENDERVRGFRGLLRAGHDSEAATIGIELGVGRRRSAVLGDTVADSIEGLAEMGDLLESLVVRGRNDDGVVRSINMKKERIREPLELAAGATNADIYRLIQASRQTIEARIGTLDRAARGS